MAVLENEKPMFELMEELYNSKFKDLVNKCPYRNCDNKCYFKLESNKRPALDSALTKDEVAHDVMLALVCLYHSDQLLKYAKKDYFNGRCIHTLSVWLIGMVISEFNNLNYSDNGGLLVKGAPFEFKKAWLLISFLHDRGYHCEETIRHNGYKKICDGFLDAVYSPKNNNEIFKNIIIYTKKEIRGYLFLSRIINIKNKEKIDHGIVGSVVGYRRYKECIDEYFGGINSFIYEPYMLIAFIVGAQHNIFKSSSIIRDTINIPLGLKRLNRKKPPLIKKENRLQVLLSLADTIEITKKIKDKSEAVEQLKKAKIKIDSNKLVLNFSDVNFNRVEKYIEDINALANWTELKTKGIAITI